MSISKNLLSACVVMMSSSMMVACNQTDSEQSSSLETNQPATISTADVSTPAVEFSKSGPSVTLSNTDVSVNTDEKFTLDITTNAFTTSEGGGITLRFDASLLQVSHVEIDNTVWNFVNQNGKINNAEGTVSDILFSSYQGVTGDVKIASVAFQSTGSGNSTITLEASSNNPFANNGQAMDVTFTTTNVSSN